MTNQLGNFTQFFEFGNEIVTQKISNNTPY